MVASLVDATTQTDEVPVQISMPTSRCTPPMVDRLKDVLTAHPGKAEVRIKLVEGPKSTMLRLAPIRVAATPALMADLKALLGPAAVGYGK